MQIASYIAALGKPEFGIDGRWVYERHARGATARSESSELRETGRNAVQPGTSMRVC